MYNAGYETQEQSKWLSNNPLGTIFTIEMADDGSVIASDYAYGCCWVFATYGAPGLAAWQNSLDGFHPVSGNRRFGLRDNGDGTYTFFTQGVDRLTGWWHILADATPFVNAFDDADQLWVCLLGHIKEIVEERQGSVSNVYEIQKCRPLLPEYNEFLYERCNDDPADLFESPCGN
ncbi:MAG: hypothetical protein IPL35_01740 [Sphingobacteriales bacterium]|nr:hypothetical protein [Sphingobacteriales bacterium]